MEKRQKAKTMTTRYATLLAGAALAALSAAGTNCADQRAPECTVPPSNNFGVRLVETGAASGTCAAEDAPLPGGIVGMRPHPVLGSDGYPDYDTPFNVSIMFQRMGELRDAAEARLADLGLDPLPEPAEAIYSFGPFATAHPEGDFCVLPATESARLVLPEIPGVPAVPPDPEDPEDMGTPEQPPLPAVDITAAWSDLRVLSTTAYPGVQFEGTLTYTENGCTRTYRATGVWGSFNVTCEGADDEGNPNGMPDQNLCLSAPNPSNILGSGINPDFPVTCDPVTLLCLLDGNFPSYKLVAAPGKRRPSMTRVDAIPIGRALVATATLAASLCGTSAARAQQPAAPPPAAQPAPPPALPPAQALPSGPPGAVPGPPGAVPGPPGAAPGAPGAMPGPAEAPPAGPQVYPPDPSAGQAAEAAMEAAPAPPKGTGYMNSKTPAYAAFGVAGIGLIVGTVTGVMALSAKKDFEDTPTYAKANRFDNLTAVADVGLGAFVLAGVTGAVLYLVSPEAAKPEAAASAAAKPRARTGFSVAPVVSPRTQGAALTLRF